MIPFVTEKIHLIQYANSLLSPSWWEWHPYTEQGGKIQESWSVAGAQKPTLSVCQAWLRQNRHEKGTKGTHSI